MASQEDHVLHRDDEEARDVYALDESLRGQLKQLVAAGDDAAIDALMEPLHPADIADLLEQVSDHERAAWLALWSRGIDGEVLSELDWGLREEVIGLLPQNVLADAVRELDSDDVVDLVEDLEDDQIEAILDALEPSDRVAVEQALAYPEESAGRLMQREVVHAPEHWTVGAMIDYLRTRKQELPEQFYHIILTDPRLKPTGYVTLGRLLSSPRATRLIDVTEDSFRTIPATQHEDDVAYAFNQYHLISAPVVDEDGRLVGVITIDDAMIVLDEGGAGRFAETRWCGRGVKPVGPCDRDDQATFPLAFREFDHGDPCLACHRAVRSGDRADRGLGGLDAHRGLDGGQCRHAIADRGGARDCHARPDAVEPDAGCAA